MSTEIGRVKGKYAGLKACLKLFLCELSCYVSFKDCEQDKLLGYKHNVDVIYEQRERVFHRDIQTRENNVFECWISR